MRKRKGRLQRQDPFELLDRAVEIVVEVVDVPNLRLDLKVERIEPLGFFQLDDRPIVLPFEQREPPRIPEMHGGRSGTQLQGSCESVLRAPTIPVVVHRDQRANLVRVGQRRVEVERLPDGPASLRHCVGCGTRAQARIEEDVGLCERRVRRRIAGIVRDGLTKLRDRPLALPCRSTC